MAAIPVVSDQDLVAGTLAGNGQDFEVLVGRYERAVYNLALRMLQNVEDAKDATQESFFKAFRSLRTFKAGAKFSTWILAIAYNASCDRLSKRRHLSGSEIPDRADPRPGPAEETEREDEAQRLRRTIDALPEKYRAVITLYHLQGKQYDEIATILGVPMGTVKTHLFRAKELLRRRLNDEPDDDEEPVAARSLRGWMQRLVVA